jgi:hypothetical protein
MWLNVRLLHVYPLDTVSCVRSTQQALKINIEASLNSRHLYLGSMLHCCNVERLADRLLGFEPKQIAKTGRLVRDDLNLLI